MICSHGYLCSGWFLPTCIVLPALVYILLGTTIEMPSSKLVNVFADSLSSHGASRVEEVLNVRKFSGVKRLPNFSLSQFECRVIPTQLPISNCANY